jgi:hypothetical protein
MGLVGGGTPIDVEGRWSIESGTNLDPDRVVYRLDPEDPQSSVSFRKIGEDILHVMAGGGTLLVGNAAWSYTLNRTDNRPSTPIGNVPDSPDENTIRPPLPPMPAGSSVLAVFEGRTPCHEIVVEFTNVTPYAGCLKIKWKLTLYQDQASGEPSTYLFQGTHTLRTGAWTLLPDTENDPDSVVYQLQLDDPGQSASFLKADENHLFLLDRTMNLLVGDALLSYTLSRVEEGLPWRARFNLSRSP